ncbi:MAG: restriction endonuclease subunit S [Eubacteriales bacterium]|nr:restriction endonuclease subunit S [Eubacteriales bacterium]
MPDGWAWARLGNIGEIITGGTPSKSHHEYYGNAFPFFKPADLDQGRKTIISSEYLSEKGKSCCRIIPKFSTAVCCIGSIGKCGYLNVEGTTNQQINSIIPNIDSLYVYYYCSSDCFSEQLLSLASATTIAIVNKSKLESVFIPVPPMVEQKRIANTLDTALELIETLEVEKSDILVAINNVKSKILDLAIRGKLVPQDPNDEPASVLLERIRAEKEELIKQGKIKRDKKESVIFKGDDNSYYEKMSTGEVKCIDDELPFVLPEGWEWCNLSMIGTTNIGLTYRPTDIESDGTIVLRSNNIINDKINLNDVVRVTAKIRENQYVKANDILICTRNGSKALVGKCAIIGDLNEPASFGAFMAIYRTDYYKYVLHYLRSNLFRIVFDDGNSTAINQLTQDMLKRALIPLPPLAEQERIVDTIDKLLSSLKVIEKSLS